MSDYIPAGHPVYPPIQAAEAAAYAELKGISAENAWTVLEQQRVKAIAAMQNDPLFNGYEPPVWKVAHALLGTPYVDAAWAERMRTKLGFEHPVQVLLINGGKRGGKSEFAGYLTTRYQVEHPKTRAWALHSKDQMSVDYQQPVFWRYMPQTWRGPKREALHYVAYKQQTGFADSKYTMPNGSDTRFWNYMMDRTTIEGGNVKIIWPDELVPKDWVEVMMGRIAEQHGWMVITFTPAEGYSPTVAMFQEGATTTMHSVGWLLPTDAKKPDVARQLGLSEDEVRELRTAYRAGRAAECPFCRPENVDAWLEPGYDPRKLVPPGRAFQLVPRVMKVNPKTDPQGIMAVLFFHIGDNPFGNPLGLYDLYAGGAENERKMNFYGLATKAITSRFTKFNVDVHTVDAAKIPKTGTNYLVIDPARGRNFFMLWLRVCPDHSIYVYREWPGNYPVPEQGIPGPWALPGDGKKLDGLRGPGAKNFGFGYWRYKREFARLEGWKQYKAGMKDTKGEQRWIEDMSEIDGADEIIFERMLDGRYATDPKMENDAPSTIITDFDELGLTFKPWPRKDRQTYEQAIIDALDYDTTQPVDGLNRPRLHIAKDCGNLIFALQIFTGEDGQTGATKDPVDTLGGFLAADAEFVDEDSWKVRGGGYH